MVLLLSILFVGIVLEKIVFWSQAVWNKLALRRTIAAASLAFTSFSSAALFVFDLSFVLLLAVVVGSFRVLNLLRVIEARVHTRHLHSVARKSALILGVAHVGVIAIWAIMQSWSITLYVWLGILVGLQLLTGLILFVSTMRTLKRTAITKTESTVTTQELPTVTVAIPARNETTDLEACLRSVVASDYPKIEILVLDDCSQLRRTPGIIKDFAHAGVRFLKGNLPPTEWLPKNYAYQRLANEANGEILLFCGVDIRFEPSTIRQLVSTMIARKKRMISVVPLREHPAMVQISLAQAVRYIWELAPPRKFFKRPPVLSSCWAIYREDLHAFGSFDAIKRAIVPEAFFSRKAVQNNDTYAFLRSNRALGLRSAKNLAAQRLTAIRTRYPALHRRPEVVLALSVFEMSVFLGSFVVVYLGSIGLVPIWATALSAISAVLFITVYMLITSLTKVTSWFLAPVWSVLAVLYDVLLMLQSMWQYEFSEVLWKGRNVCLPVMEVIPRLPDTEPQAPL